jgi:hypothetical protein
MISTEPIIVVVRTGRAGRYVDWRTTPELLPPWHRQSHALYALVHRELHGVWGGLSEADRRRRLAHP